MALSLTLREDNLLQNHHIVIYTTSMSRLKLQVVRSVEIDQAWSISWKARGKEGQPDVGQRNKVHSQNRHEILC